MKFLNSALVSFFLFTVVPAQAKLNKLETMREDAKALVKNAIANRYNEINGTSLLEILENISKPKLKSMKRIVIVADGREGGYYEPATKTIYINERILDKKTHEVRSILMLHELLGAANYNDRNYSTSLQIYYGDAKFADDPLINSFLRDRALDKWRNTFAGPEGGSSTSTGGGGDPDTLTTKISTLDTLRALRKNEILDYKGAGILQMAQITFDCTYEFYTGEYAVDASVFNQLLVKLTQPVPTVQLRPWAKLSIRKDWYFGAQTQNQSTLILDGLASIARLGNNYCDIRGIPDFYPHNELPLFTN